MKFGNEKLVTIQLATGSWVPESGNFHNIVLNDDAFINTSTMIRHSFSECELKYSGVHKYEFIMRKHFSKNYIRRNKTPLFCKRIHKPENLFGINYKIPIYIHEMLQSSDKEIFTLGMHQFKKYYEYERNL